MTPAIDPNEERPVLRPRTSIHFLSASGGNSAEFPQWVPWAILFTLLRRFHDLIDSPKFAASSAVLQAIELNRSLTPLLNRLSSERFLLQEFGAFGTGLSVELLLPRFQRLLSGFKE